MCHQFNPGAVHKRRRNFFGRFWYPPPPCRNFYHDLPNSSTSFINGPLHKISDAGRMQSRTDFSYIRNHSCNQMQMKPYTYTQRRHIGTLINDAYIQYSHKKNTYDLRTSINASWVMTFLIWGYKISLTYKIMRSKEIAVFCELT